MESPGWGEFLDPLAGHLQETEQLSRYAAHALAGQILELERNLACQREALIGLSHFQKSVVRFQEGSAATAARMERALETVNLEGISQKEHRDAVRLFPKLGRAELRGKLKREATGVCLELRYFNAASSGLMKGLKDMVGLPINA